MTNPELIARLRENQSYEWQDPIWETRLAAADRIEQLVVTNEALEAKLAKTAKVALAYEDWVTDAYDLLEERREEFDPESPSDKAIMDLMDKAEAGIARATLAEISSHNKGESHE